MTAEQIPMATVRISFLVATCLIFPQYIGFKAYGLALSGKVFNKTGALLVPSLAFFLIASILIAIEAISIKMSETQVHCGTWAAGAIVVIYVLIPLHMLCAMALNVWRKPKSIKSA